MPFARINGLFLHYLDETHAPPWRRPEVALLHHGALRTGAMWYGWLPELTAGLRVLRLDARGHGRSQAPPPGQPWRIEDLVADVRGLIEKLGVGPVHYVGESLGGVIGILLAATAPALVRTLTLCATPTQITAGASRLRALDYPDWASAVAALGVRGWYMAYRARTNDLHPEDPGRDEWFAAQAALSTPASIFGLTQMVAGFDVRDRLGAVRAPALVLSPARSPLSAGPAQQAALAAALPNARLEIIDGPGHHIYLDRAAECARRCRQFIEENRPAGHSASGRV